jgi:hypothetical protein
VQHLEQPRLFGAGPIEDAEAALLEADPRRPVSR